MSEANLAQRLVRWATAWAWRHEITTCEGIAELQALNMDQEKMELRIKQDPALAQYIATCFASLVAQSPNYTEMIFNCNGKFNNKWDWMTVTIQKGNGQTPHQLRQKAERELDDLKRKLNPPNKADQPPTNQKVKS